MILCPFCHFQNEDGALFCEQCKSDLTGVEPVVPATPVAADEVPVAGEVVAEAVPIEATPIEATPVEGIPVEGVPVEATPIEAVAVAEVEAAPMVQVEPEPAPEPPPAPAPEPVVQAPPAPLPAAPPAAPAAPATVQGAPPPAPAPAPSVPPVGDGKLPAGAQPRLVVMRGLKRNVEYPIYEGQNFIGRADEKPVDIDLEDQEPPDRIWSSRQHALIIFENGTLTIEDLNSSNGTFLNRNKIYPAQPQQLKPNDVIQIGTVQLKLVV